MLTRFNYINKYNMQYIITKHSNKLEQRSKQKMKPDENVFIIIIKVCD